MEIRLLTVKDGAAVKIPNEAFELFGRLIVSRTNDTWTHREVVFDETTQQTFPEENYQIEELLSKGFVGGAFDETSCLGVAIFEDYWLKYAYLSDLKVAASYRGKGIAGQLIDFGLQEAKKKGYQGIWTIGQDNNLGACRFYLKSGFVIGGLDTRIYKHTAQEGKANIHFYLE